MRTLPANSPGLFLSVHQKVPKLVLECQRQAWASNKFYGKVLDVLQKRSHDSAALMPANTWAHEARRSHGHRRAVYIVSA
jgi:hypothetical protein